MRIAIGCDEAAYDLKELIKQELVELHHDVQDFGTYDRRPVMYPDVAFAVAEQVAAGMFERAILLCGTGIGMAICANKVPGVRAAQAHDAYSAERAARSNDAQVLTLGARVVGPELARTIVRAWLAASFDPARSGRKVELIRAYERRTHGAIVNAG
ncbi:RpiB/LacA/LacB family sugar-phosphate isomerase [Anaeromyxobacter oryzae]|uniref:Ribose-5-phosphate isomerase n=1 Tax=Anaeromyxobacter oryzae TaxID=2918170 RepID=A0ABM7WPB2_9BACT|nr:RpiB/LacA/LacB family sugar-phosphate isomerase [Anaeromyxobacter oryzae]BDG01302.1 ribose-5-phosphate isomerase [Anaeromyxobacter oryzae]